MQACKERVKDVYERIINLEIAYELNAAFFHIFEGAASAKGLEASAMAVGRAGYVGLVGQKNSAVEAEIGQCALLKYEDVFFIEPIVIVPPENSVGFGVVERAGHNVPGAGGVVFLRRCSDGFGKDLKEGLVLYGADWEISFWAVEAKARSLSAGDDKGGDLAGRYQLPAELSCLGVSALLVWTGRARGVGGGRSEIGRHGGGSGFSYETDYPIVYFGKVQRLNLFKQALLLGAIQLLPKGQKMALVVVFQHFFQVFNGSLVNHTSDFKLKNRILSEFSKFSRKLQKFDEIHLTG